MPSQEREIGDQNQPSEAYEEQQVDNGLTADPNKTFFPSNQATITQSIKAKLQRARGLFIPYFIPLIIVYISEYTINIGVAPTLLFPLATAPFNQYREFYTSYSAIYQSGVFISRSTAVFFHFHNLYLPSLLQFANLFLLTPPRPSSTSSPTSGPSSSSSSGKAFSEASSTFAPFSEISDNVPDTRPRICSVSPQQCLTAAASVSPRCSASLSSHSFARGKSETAGDYCKRI